MIFIENVRAHTEFNYVNYILPNAIKTPKLVLNVSKIHKRVLGAIVDF